ncbi:competence protein ComK [Virgibacillus halodenitrificans]|uniref:Competence protein ComK n=1 Tax=Virgibacillus halodenitrificans TaxID=1482 RepID=A0ABR7VKS2_VIRHA|nr:competence protein ComK [Virgibacillus halodenitrificans]MBD1221447.1 competence protein ComK [Virgibacillus halodenitrificans]MCG1028183.1 competence protein ComK [Virgibacillus halodenitrificans]MEC2158951.1 competence protein ComK [Virgibacillus halodenitrificans]CDQ31513.1 Competence protein K [Virgibacillus halodenitrificans]
MKKLYMITNKTKAISLHKHSTHFRSSIIEAGSEEETSCVFRPEQIIDQNCIIYGSTLKRRQIESKHILQLKNKLPVRIIPEKNIYMFPTASIKNEACIWVAYQHIRGCIERFNKTYILFKDGTDIPVEASHRSVDLQYIRTGQLVARQNDIRLFGNASFTWLN